MSDATRRLFFATAVSFLAGFLFFLATSAFAFPVRDVLLRFQWDWIMRNALARLIDAVPALQVFSVLLTFSLLINLVEIRASKGEVPSFFSLVNGPIVFLLVMTVLYAVLVLVAQPRLESGRDELAARTQMSERFRAQADENFANGKYSLAATELRHYLAINPDDQEVLDLLQEATDLAERQADRDEPEGLEEVRRITDRQDLDAAESLRLAQQYYESENYITALYYARLARELDPEREDAARLVGVAMERLATGGPTEAETEERTLFLRKRAGYRAFEQGRYLDAYYLFRDLAERYPGDPDVRLYLRDVREKLQEQAFFLEEILPIVAMTGGTDLTFLNRPDKAGSEYLHIDKVVQSATGTYAMGIEALGVNDDGTLLYHLAAPYGKVRDGTLNMHAVSEKDRDDTVAPRYYAGSRPDEIEHVVMLHVPARDLAVIAKANESLRSAVLGDLLRMTSVLDDYGYGIHRPRSELLRRILEPFSFIVIALFAIALAWQLRSRYVARPPIAALALVPLFPFVVYYGFVCYRYAMHVLSTHLLLHIGMAGSLAATVGFQGVLLVVALLLVATRMAE